MKSWIEMMIAADRDDLTAEEAEGVRKFWAKHGEEMTALMRMKASEIPIQIITSGFKIERKVL